jgi:hypothetical protein
VLDGILSTYTWHQHNGMDSKNLNIKFFARQANTIYKYKNLKVKLTNCNENTHLNRNTGCVTRYFIYEYLYEYVAGKVKMWSHIIGMDRP